MRTILSLALLSLATIGCQTQTWRGTHYEEGTRSSDSVFQVRSGLVEVNAGFRAGAGSIKDGEVAGFDDYSSSATAWSGFVGYMINDFWELGAFIESVNESWEADNIGVSGDAEGFVWGGRVIYNFSTVSTDVVPFIACTVGTGSVDWSGDGGDDDSDRFTWGVGGGVRIFGWNRFAVNLEGYYRRTSDEFDDSNVTERANEIGGAISFSYFF